MSTDLESSNRGAAVSRGDLLTEQRNPRSMELDSLSITETLTLINSEDQGVAAAVGRALPQIALFTEAVVHRFKDGGRLIYIGAGTSGRLGVLDAAECPPTFSTPPEMVVGVIAGGLKALTRSIEGAEDHGQTGADDLKNLMLTSADAVLGITTGGTTPYVLGALEYARQVGAYTGLLVCSDEAHQAGSADQLIAIPVGPEVVTGSTRMKAGTATKLALNMITTTAMVQLNKTYSNLMVDLKALNDKLRDRGTRIVTELTGLQADEALNLLRRAGGEVKTAILMQEKGLTAAGSRAELELRGGSLRQALRGES